MDAAIRVGTLRFAHPTPDLYRVPRQHMHYCPHNYASIFLNKSISMFIFLHHTPVNSLMVHRVPEMRNGVSDLSRTLKCIIFIDAKPTKISRLFQKFGYARPLQIIASRSIKLCSEHPLNKCNTEHNNG